MSFSSRGLENIFVNNNKKYKKVSHLKKIIMPISKKSHVPILMTYKRDKIEISGDPQDVKKIIWTDLILSKFRIVSILSLLQLFSKYSWLNIVINWLKKCLMIVGPILTTIGYLTMWLHSGFPGTG